MMIKKNIILFLLFLQMGVLSYAQEIGMSLDTNSITIGEVIELDLSFKGLSDQEILWPVFTDTLTKDIEILKSHKPDTLIDDGAFELKQKLLISVYDSGYFVLNPIKVGYKYAMDSAYNFLETDPALIEVLAVAVDTSMAIRDIKKPMEAPLTFEEVLPNVFIGISIVLFVLLVYFLVKTFYKKKAKPQEEEEIVEIIPDEWALEELAKVRHAKLWQNDRIKEYYTSISDITREYIELKFKVAALENTSDEIISDLVERKVNAEVLNKLEQAFSLCDLVKFAKAKPMPLEHEMCMEHFVDFIHETKAPSGTEEKVIKERRMHE